VSNARVKNVLDEVLGSQDIGWSCGLHIRYSSRPRVNHGKNGPKKLKNQISVPALT